MRWWQPPLFFTLQWWFWGSVNVTSIKKKKSLTGAKKNRWSKHWWKSWPWAKKRKRGWILDVEHCIVGRVRRGKSFLIMASIFPKSNKKRICLSLGIQPTITSSRGLWGWKDGLDQNNDSPPSILILEGGTVEPLIWLAPDREQMIQMQLFFCGLLELKIRKIPQVDFASLKTLEGSTVSWHSSYRALRVVWILGPGLASGQVITNLREFNTAVLLPDPLW